MPYNSCLGEGTGEVSGDFSQKFKVSPIKVN